MGKESRFSKEVRGFLVGDWCGESGGVASGCVIGVGETERSQQPGVGRREDRPMCREGLRGGGSES